MTSNLFGPPKNSGDRAARRAIKDVHRYADLLGREHEEAVTGELNCIRQFNQTRIQLESSVNHLRTLTDVPETIVDRVNTALTKGQDMLNNFDPIEPVAGADAVAAIPAAPAAPAIPA